MATLAGIARCDTTRAPMQELDSTDISIDNGVAGDFRGRARKRQVTILSTDDWRRACADLGTETALDHAARQFAGGWSGITTQRRRYHPDRGRRAAH